MMQYVDALSSVLDLDWINSQTRTLLSIIQELHNGTNFLLSGIFMIH